MQFICLTCTVHITDKCNQLQLNVSFISVTDSSVIHSFVVNKRNNAFF